MACAKDPRKARVQFNAYCNGCDVECTTSDATLERSHAASTLRFTATADEGTLVTLRAEPTSITDTAATIWIKVDDEENGFRWVHPTTAEHLVPAALSVEVGE